MIEPNREGSAKLSNYGIVEVERTTASTDVVQHNNLATKRRCERKKKEDGFEELIVELDGSRLTLAERFKKYLTMVDQCSTHLALCNRAYDLCGTSSC